MPFNDSGNPPELRQNLAQNEFHKDKVEDENTEALAFRVAESSTVMVHPHEKNRPKSVVKREARERVRRWAQAPSINPDVDDQPSGLRLNLVYSAPPQI